MSAIAITAKRHMDEEYTLQQLREKMAEIHSKLGKVRNKYTKAENDLIAERIANYVTMQ